MNKYEKEDDFIGWKSEDGKLEVVGVAGKTRSGRVVYKVICTECSKDIELFPLGYFVNTKGNLLRGIKPCGCSKKPNWKDWQYLIRARRIGEENGFIVHGFAEYFKGTKTKLNLECLKDGYKWVTNINNIINRSSGCPKCAVYSRKEKQKIPENIALQNCVDICKEEGYEPLGFPSGYENVHSCFEYVCPKHGKQSVTYNNFANMGGRCPDCWKEISGFYGYYPERKNEQDFLYVLNFDDKFIKVGRSFDVRRRISQLKLETKIKNIKKLYVLTGTHQEIYDLEQELHNELRERGFGYSVDWSTECFDNDSLGILNKLLGNCGSERVK